MDKTGEEGTNSRRRSTRVAAIAPPPGDSASQIPSSTLTNTASNSSNSSTGTSRARNTRDRQPVVDSSRRGPKSAHNRQRGPWTEEEDDLLRELVTSHGAHHWSKIAQNFESRTGKQCRERFHNVLNPDINLGPWTPEEDLMLGDLLAQHGRSWALMSRIMHENGFNRTDNALKNRWNSSIRRQQEIQTGNHGAITPRPRKAKGATTSNTKKTKEVTPSQNLRRSTRHARDNEVSEQEEHGGDDDDDYDYDGRDEVAPRTPARKSRRSKASLEEEGEEGEEEEEEGEYSQLDEYDEDNEHVYEYEEHEYDNDALPPNRRATRSSFATQVPVTGVKSHKSRPDIPLSHSQSQTQTSQETEYYSSQQQYNQHQLHLHPHPQPLNLQHQSSHHHQQQQQLLRQLTPRSLNDVTLQKYPSIPPRTTTATARPIGAPSITLAKTNIISASPSRLYPCPTRPDIFSANVTGVYTSTTTTPSHLPTTLPPSLDGDNDITSTYSTAMVNTNPPSAHFNVTSPIKSKPQLNFLGEKRTPIHAHTASVPAIPQHIRTQNINTSLHTETTFNKDLAFAQSKVNRAILPAIPPSSSVYRPGDPLHPGSTPTKLCPPTPQAFRPHSSIPQPPATSTTVINNNTASTNNPPIITPPTTAPATTTTGSVASVATPTSITAVLSNSALAVTSSLHFSTSTPIKNHTPSKIPPSFHDPTKEGVNAVNRGEFVVPPINKQTTAKTKSRLVLDSFIPTTPDRAHNITPSKSIPKPQPVLAHTPVYTNNHPTMPIINHTNTTALPGSNINTTSRNAYTPHTATNTMLRNNTVVKKNTTATSNYLLPTAHHHNHGNNRTNGQGENKEGSFGAGMQFFTPFNTFTNSGGNKQNRNNNISHGNINGNGDAPNIHTPLHNHNNSSDNNNTSASPQHVEVVTHHPPLPPLRSKQYSSPAAADLSPASTPTSASASTISTSTSGSTPMLPATTHHPAYLLTTPAFTQVHDLRSTPSANIILPTNEQPTTIQHPPQSLLVTPAFANTGPQKRTQYPTAEIDEELSRALKHHKPNADDTTTQSNSPIPTQTPIPLAAPTSSSDNERHPGSPFDVTAVSDSIDPQTVVSLHG